MFYTEKMLKTIFYIKRSCFVVIFPEVKTFAKTAFYGVDCFRRWSGYEQLNVPGASGLFSTFIVLILNCTNIDVWKVGLLFPSELPIADCDRLLQCLSECLQHFELVKLETVGQTRRAASSLWENALPVTCHQNLEPGAWGGRSFKHLPAIPNWTVLTWPSCFLKSRRQSLF